MKTCMFAVIVLVGSVASAGNPQLLEVPADDGGAALLSRLLMDFQPREPVHLPPPKAEPLDVPVVYTSLADSDFKPIQKPVQKGGAKAGVGRASGGYSSGFAVPQQAGIFQGGGCRLLRALFPRARRSGFVRYSTAPAFRGFASGSS